MATEWSHKKRVRNEFSESPRSAGSDFELEAYSSKATRKLVCTEKVFRKY